FFDDGNDLFVHKLPGRPSHHPFLIVEQGVEFDEINSREARHGGLLPGGGAAGPGSGLILAPSPPATASKRRIVTSDLPSQQVVDGTLHGCYKFLLCSAAGKGCGGTGHSGNAGAAPRRAARIFPANEPWRFSDNLASCSGKLSRPSWWSSFSTCFCERISSAPWSACSTSAGRAARVPGAKQSETGPRRRKRFAPGSRPSRRPARTSTPTTKP